MADNQDDPNNGGEDAGRRMGEYLAFMFLNTVHSCAQKLGMSYQSMCIAVHESPVLWEHIIVAGSIRRETFVDHAKMIRDRLFEEIDRIGSPPPYERKNMEAREEEIKAEIRQLILMLDVRGEQQKRKQEQLDAREETLSDWTRFLRNALPQKWHAMQIVCNDNKRQLASSEQMKLRIIEDYKEKLLKLIQQLYTEAERKMKAAVEKEHSAMEIVRKLKRNVNWEAIENAFENAHGLLKHVEELDEGPESNKEYLRNLRSLERGFIHYTKSRPMRAAQSNFCIIGVLEYQTETTTKPGEEVSEEEPFYDLWHRCSSAPPEVHGATSSENEQIEGSRKATTSSGGQDSVSVPMSFEVFTADLGFASTASEAPMESEDVTDGSESSPNPSGTSSEDQEMPDSQTSSEAAMESESGSQDQDSQSVRTSSGASMEPEDAQETAPTASEAPMESEDATQGSESVPTTFVARRVIKTEALSRATSPEPSGASSEDQEMPGSQTSSEAAMESESGSQDQDSQSVPTSSGASMEPEDAQETVPTASEAPMESEDATQGSESVPTTFVALRVIKTEMPSRATSPEPSGASSEDQEMPGSQTSSEAAIDSESSPEDQDSQSVPMSSSETAPTSSGALRVIKQEVPSRGTSPEPSGASSEDQQVPMAVRRDPPLPVVSNVSAAPEPVKPVAPAGDESAESQENYARCNNFLVSAMRRPLALDPEDVASEDAAPEVQVEEPSMDPEPSPPEVAPQAVPEEVAPEVQVEEPTMDPEPSPPEVAAQAVPEEVAPEDGAPEDQEDEIYEEGYDTEGNPIIPLEDPTDEEMDVANALLEVYHSLAGSQN